MADERKTAFILAGGASRGAYQAGCLKRLSDQGIEPDLIVGSSIGVCNALVYMSSGAQAAWDMWAKAVSLPKVVRPSLRHNALLGNSLFSMSGLNEMVEEAVDFERCLASETEITFILANLSEGHEELRGNRTESSVERFRTVSRIGYTIPLLHPLIELDGDLYADGGFLWNVPFEYAEEWGATDVYILSVLPSELPRAGSLRTMPQVAARMYEVFWRTFGNSSYLEKHLDRGEYHGIRVTIVEPKAESGMFDPLGMINAHPRKSKRLLEDGYRDTDRVLRSNELPDGRVKGKVPDRATAREPQRTESGRR
jgi:NTE family protein